SPGFRAAATTAASPESFAASRLLTAVLVRACRRRTPMPAVGGSATPYISIAICPLLVAFAARTLTAPEQAVQQNQGSLVPSRCECPAQELVERVRLLEPAVRCQSRHGTASAVAGAAARLRRRRSWTARAKTRAVDEPGPATRSASSSAT